MKIIVNGIAAEYADEGSGPALVMLHGWKDSMQSFELLVPALSQKFRVVRLDMPGFGKSELPPKSWKLDEYVDFVAAFRAKMDISDYVLVGHSFGGRVILKGIARGVFSPKKAILIASAGLADRKTTRNRGLAMLARTGKLLTAPLPKVVRTALRKRLYKNIGSDYMNAGALKDIFVNVISEHLGEAASQVKVPTLLIWGSADEQTPLEEGVQLHHLIKGSRFELFQAAGHFVHREHPDAVAKLIVDFV